MCVCDTTNGARTLGAVASPLAVVVAGAGRRGFWGGGLGCGGKPFAAKPPTSSRWWNEMNGK